MTTLKTFDFDKVSVKDMRTLYAVLHPLADGVLDESVAGLIPTSKCLWVDSAGAHVADMENVYLESVQFKDVVKKTGQTYFSDDRSFAIFSKALYTRFDLSRIVFYRAPFFKYKTLEECRQDIETFKKISPDVKIIMVMDIKFLIFNRIRLTNDDAVSILKPGTNKKLSTFLYYLEF